MRVRSTSKLLLVLYIFVTVAGNVIQQALNNTDSLSEKFQQHSRAQCAVFTSSEKLAAGSAVQVHEKSVFLATCECNGAADDSITWIHRGSAVDGATSDVIISNTLFQSTITLESISKLHEGLWCCSNNSSFVCLRLHLVRPPVLSMSILSDVQCQTETNSSKNQTVEVQCVISSLIENDVTQSFVVLYVNNVGTISYDLHPRNGTNKDGLGRKVWTQTYNFGYVVRNRDVLDCRWFHKGGKELQSARKWTVNFGKCSVPTIDSYFTTERQQTGHNYYGVLTAAIASVSSILVGAVLLVLIVKIVKVKIRSRPKNDSNRLDRDETDQTEIVETEGSTAATSVFRPGESQQPTNQSEINVLYDVQSAPADGQRNEQTNCEVSLHHFSSGSCAVQGSSKTDSYPASNPLLSASKEKETQSSVDALQCSAINPGFDTESHIQPIEQKNIGNNFQAEATVVLIDSVSKSCEENRQIMVEGFDRLEDIIVHNIVPQHLRYQDSAPVRDPKIVSTAV